MARLCKRGHDLDVVGQYKSNKACRECGREKATARRAIAEIVQADRLRGREYNRERYRTQEYRLQQSMRGTINYADRQLAKLEARRAELWT
jgi:hypothetical protein